MVKSTNAKKSPVVIVPLARDVLMLAYEGDIAVNKVFMHCPPQYTCVENQIHARKTR